jgi:hypothetical protein
MCSRGLNAAQAGKIDAKSDAKSLRPRIDFLSNLLNLMVSRAGLEPATIALKEKCSPLGQRHRDALSVKSARIGLTARA